MKNNLKIAGLLIGLGALYFIVAMMLSEALYPGYSISNNYISDLGVGPSAWLFNSSIDLLGVLITIGSYFLYLELRDKIFTALVFIAGAGAMGVGMFNESFGVIHILVSAAVFVAGSIAAIYFGIKWNTPLRYPSIVLGVISLSATALLESGVYMGLGPGGMERMIVYPTLLWAILFSGSLLTLKTIGNSRHKN